jgi:hypothetical protein
VVAAGRKCLPGRTCLLVGIRLLKTLLLERDKRQSKRRIQEVLAILISVCVLASISLLALARTVWIAVSVICHIREGLYDWTKDTDKY